MKQFITLVLLALLPAAVAQAQTSSPATPSAAPAKGGSQLAGRVLDAATQRPIEYATVALLLVRAGSCPANCATGNQCGNNLLLRVSEGVMSVNHKVSRSIAGTLTDLLMTGKATSHYCSLASFQLGCSP